MIEPEGLAAGVRILTPRLILRLAEPADATSIVAYYRRNEDRLRPVEPERPPIFYEERFWRMQARQNQEDLAADRALRLFVFAEDAPERVIGNIGFSNVVRGVGQYCTLGYSIDGDEEGKGLMAEALRGAIGHVFGPLNFHRIEANYLPRNERSGALLRRLGFQVEGYSRDYLRINGRWEDHIRTALVNPAWAPERRG